VAQVCRLVQGMPLAILLAAAWMEMLSPAEIVAELERGYDLLQADLRDLPERQRSIEAVCDASWRMLDGAEQDAFARLSVFRGGFTRRAAEEVAGADLRTLFSLVHKSFLQRDAAGRYQVHELLRQYAEHKLAEAPEVWERTNGLHCNHYLEVLQRAVVDGKRGAGWGALLLEIDNIRAGWHWAVSQGRFDRVCRYATNLFPALSWGLGWRQEAAAAFGWAAKVLRTYYADWACKEAGVALGMILARQGTARAWGESPEDIERGMQLMQEGTSLLRRLGARREFADSVEPNFWGPKHCVAATQLLQEQLVVFRELGDREGMVLALSQLGELAICQGDLEKAERCYHQQVEICQTFGRTLLTDACLSVLGGKVAYHRGEYEKARQLYQKSLDSLAQQRLISVRVLYSYLGDVALATADYSEARDCYREALTMQQTADWGEWAESLSGDHYGMAYSLDRIGDIALALGDIEEARMCYRQARQIARDHPDVALHLDVLVSRAALLARERGAKRAVELAALALRHPVSHAEMTSRAQRLLDQLETQLPPGVFAAALERGQARELETAMREIFTELESDG
jgi:tetratricopeptide (TPR) repeat protein